MKRVNTNNAVTSAFQLKILWFFVIGSLVIGVLSFGYSYMHSSNVVYVDAIRLLANYKGMEDAKKELSSKRELWKTNLDTLREEVEAVMQDYEKSKAVATKREKELLENLIRSKQEQYFAYEQSVKEQNQKQDEELTSKLITKLNDYLKRYGAEKGYSIILAATQFGNIAYGEQSLDITDEALAGLNAEYQKMN
jgi:outer membrane protein